MPFIIPHADWEGISPWLLLTYNSLGCRQRAGQEMQGVPVPCQADPHTSSGAANDSPNLCPFHAKRIHTLSGGWISWVLFPGSSVGTGFSMSPF
jgi:hypothetical protein